MTSLRKTKNRRGAFSAVAVFAVAALAMAGCTTDSGGDDGKKDSGDKVTIEYWHRLPSVEGAKTVDDLVGEWNKDNPNIEVKATTLQGSAGDSYPKIAAAVKAGNAPCLAQVGVDRVPDLLSTGQLLDVSEHVSGYKADYLEYAWNKATFADKSYGLPQDTGPIVLYYRTDLFEAAGVTVPTTWEEYRAAGEKIKAANPAARIGSFLPDEAMWLMALSSANGASWWEIDGDSWKVNIDDAPTQKVAEYWQGLITDGIVHTFPRWDPTFDQALNDGTLAATIGASWEAPLIMDSSPDTAGKWGVAQIPAWDAAKPMVGEDGGSIVAALKGCENPKEAMEFTNWLNTKVDGLMPIGLFPAVPAPSAGFETPAALKEFYGGQDIYKEFSTANDNVNPKWSFSPTTGSTMTALSDGMGKMADGGPPLPEIIKNAQEDSIKSLESAGITVKK